MDSGKQDINRDGKVNKVENSKQLEFVVFCIENIAVFLGKGAEQIYKLLTEDSNILKDYIIPEYEILHTQSKEYIVEDIIEVMRERGVCI